LRKGREIEYLKTLNRWERNMKDEARRSTMKIHSLFKIKTLRFQWLQIFFCYYSQIMYFIYLQFSPSFKFYCALWLNKVLAFFLKYGIVVFLYGVFWFEID
jgi:hypothetical protein